MGGSYTVFYKSNVSQVIEKMSKSNVSKWILFGTNQIKTLERHKNVQVELTTNASLYLLSQIYGMLSI